jgi:hypothetical protein
VEGMPSLVSEVHPVETVQSLVTGFATDLVWSSKRFVEVGVSKVVGVDTLNGAFTNVEIGGSWQS